MNKQRIVMILFFTLFCCTFPSFGSQNVILYWFEKVAEGVYEVDEPLLPSNPGFLNDSQSEYVHQLNKKQTPLSFYSFLRESDYLRLQADNPCIRKVSGIVLPRELAAAVINRRLPIVNTFKFDKEKFSDSRTEDPKYYCHATLNNYFDYLGVVQLAMMHFLINENDLRFEKEACEFLDYFYTPFPENLDKVKMKDRDARLCYSRTMGGTASFLPLYMRMYINLCLKKRNAPELDSKKDWFESEYAKKCNYYDLENWTEYLRQGPTEEEKRRFRETTRKDYEERKKRYKGHEKGLNERALKNALETLKQPDLSPQDRECLERFINQLETKNKQ